MYAPKTMNMRVYTAFRAMLDKARKAHSTDRDMSMFFFLFSYVRFSADWSSAGFTGYAPGVSGTWGGNSAFEVGYGEGGCVAGENLP